MKSKRLIQRELERRALRFRRNRSERIFAVFPTLPRLCSFLHFVQHQALQLVRTLKLILGAATERSSVHEQLIEQQVEQEQPRVPRPRPLTLRPAAAHLAPPA